MEKLLGILKMIVPVLVMLGIGMLCRKKGVIHQSGLAGLKTLAVNICLPAVLFRAFYSAAYSLDIIIITIAMFVVCVIALWSGVLFRRISRGPRLVPFLMTGFEAGMLGYALYTLMFGQNALTHFATVDLGQVLFVFTVYLYWLRRSESGQSVGLSASLKSMVTSPVIIAIVLGVIVGLTGLGQQIDASPAGSIVSGTLDFIAAPTAAVILLVVGFELTLSRENIKAALPSVLARMLLMAVLCAALLLTLGSLIAIPEPLKWAFILMFILPPPFVLPVFTTDEGQTAFASAALSIHTLLSLIAFAIIAFIIA